MNSNENCYVGKALEKPILLIYPEFQITVYMAIDLVKEMMFNFPFKVIPLTENHLKDFNYSRKTRPETC